MANCRRPGKAAKNIGFGKRIGDKAELALRMEMVAVESGDAGGFLPAVLQSVKAECCDGRRVIGADNAENATLLV